MADHPAGRVGVDVAGTLIVTGAKTVFINNKEAAVEGGNTVGSGVFVSSPTTVFVENKHLVVEGAVTSKGSVLNGGSRDVRAG